MKVLFYNHTGSVSGAEKVLFTVVSGLKQAGHETVLMAPSSPAIVDFVTQSQTVFHPVPVLTARYTSNPVQTISYLASFAKLALQVRTLIKAENPDLVHANSTRAGIVASLASIGTDVTIIWHVHDLLPKHPFSAAVRMLSVLSGRNKIIAVSHATARSFQTSFVQHFRNRLPMHVVHNGIEIAPRIDPDHVSRLRDELRILPGERLIGVVGQIAVRKRQLEVIRAFSSVVKFHPEAKLLIVGAPIFNSADKEYFSLLQAEARHLGLTEKVLFLGQRSDVSVILNALDVLVLNSSSEPFSMALLEALSFGVPVAAACVDGVPELIENGVSGLLFPSGDREALVGAIRMLLDNPELARRLSLAGRDVVCSRFTRQIFLEKIIHVYRSCLSTSRASSRVKISADHR